MDSKQTAVAQEFDAHAQSYGDTVNGAIGVPGLTVDLFTRLKAEHLCAFLKQELADIRQAKVLDLGCGVGTYHKLVAPEVGALHGVDVSEKSIELAKQAHPAVTYQIYDGMTLPYAEGSMDAIFTICVMHHVPVHLWTGFVAECHRVLRPGGIFLVYEHNPINPATRLVVSRCEFDRDAVLLWPARVRRLMTGAKFKVLNSRSLFTLPPVNRAMQHADRAFARLPFGAQYWVAGKKAA